MNERSSRMEPSSDRTTWARYWTDIYQQRLASAEDAKRLAEKFGAELTLSERTSLAPHHTDAEVRAFFRQWFIVLPEFPALEDAFAAGFRKANEIEFKATPHERTVITSTQQGISGKGGESTS